VRNGSTLHQDLTHHVLDRVEEIERGDAFILDHILEGRAKLLEVGATELVLGEPGLGLTSLLLLNEAEVGRSLHHFLELPFVDLAIAISVVEHGEDVRVDALDLVFLVKLCGSLVVVVFEGGLDFAGELVKLLVGDLTSFHVLLSELLQLSGEGLGVALLSGDLLLPPLLEKLGSFLIDDTGINSSKDNVLRLPVVEHAVFVALLVDGADDIADNLLPRAALLCVFECPGATEKEDSAESLHCFFL